ncbi:hypothetical protein RP20_CCG025733 [Aedes albopictus]|nr:hypothetical protein RP20_CCG025733 [Aedes albopictus]
MTASEFSCESSNVAAASIIIVPPSSSSPTMQCKTHQADPPAVVTWSLGADDEDDDDDGERHHHHHQRRRPEAGDHLPHLHTNISREQVDIDSDDRSAFKEKQQQQLLLVPKPDGESIQLIPKAATFATMPVKYNHHGSTSLLDQIPEDTQPEKKPASTSHTNGATPRRPSVVVQDILSTHRPSAIMSALRRGSMAWLPGRSKSGQHGHDYESNMGSKASLSQIPHGTGAHSELAMESRRKNRRIGDDALSTALSALYAKVIVILGIALPVTEILSSQIPANVYQGFYLYLYTVSILFVIFVYASNMRRRAVMTLIKTYLSAIINTTSTTIASATTNFDSSSEEDTDFLLNSAFQNRSKRTASHDAAEYIECQRTNIMGTLVQNASPFLFPCTIEYSLICAVILYEMWKKVKTIAEIDRTRRNSQKVHSVVHTKSAHHFSVDCSRAHRGMFGGIIITVMTIICLIMYFVLHDEPGYEYFALQEVTIAETVLYSITAAGVILAMIRMRDLKYCKKHNDKHASSVSLDCTLLVLAQTGVYVYGMFSIVGSYFAIQKNIYGAQEGLIAEVFSLVQTSMQTLFILNAVWRKCRGAQQNRTKPGREIVTFLLVANMAMWFINTLVKGRASFRPTHLDFFGTWAWTVITHVSMPLAIFYRFHSTICLFEIWKSTYKVKSGEHH